MSTLKSIHNYIKSFWGVFTMKMNNKNSSCEMISDKTRMVNRFLHVTLSLMIVSSFNLFAASADSAKHWVGTWACAPYPMGSNNTDMPPAIANNTVRQIVRVSIGSDTLRVKFSNKTCSSPVTMKAVNIAVSPDGTKSPVTASTITALKFNGEASITMNAGATAVSDPVAFDLKPSMRLAITIYYGTAGNGNDLTGHVASRTDSYVATGDQTSNATLTGTVKSTTHWLHISAIDVWADTMTYAVACLGNSITDGYGLSGGLQNRWTDAFSVKLLANPSTAKVGVLNLGIGATNITGTGVTTGMSRYKQDVLEQSGVRWFLVFYGVNDINGGVQTSAITSAYKTMVNDGHAKKMKVYGATITPFKGNSYYSADHEAKRQEINKWIRTAGNFDTFVDFDKAMQDPSNPEQYLATYKNDGLHPNAVGYKAMGESLNLKLFEIIPVATRNADFERLSNDVFEKLNFNSVHGKTMVTFEIPHDAFVSLKVYTLLGKEIAEIAGKNFSSGKHTVELKDGNLSRGTYIYSIKTDKFSVSNKMVFPAN